MSNRDSHRRTGLKQEATKSLSQPGRQSSNEAYERACRYAAQNELAQARSEFESFLGQSIPDDMRALAENDLATLDALEGRESAALARLVRALELDHHCAAAKKNYSLLTQRAINVPMNSAPAVPNPSRDSSPRIRVAVVSLLFNWPSTGGGTIHTLETGKFLNRAGYEVKHFYASYPEWGIGNVGETLPIPSEPLIFHTIDWNAAEIQRRFREAIGRFAPDYVIITDSWNFKPLLAHALNEFRYFLRLAAQECLCPLNNVRMLPDDNGRISSCPRHQLATGDACRQCVSHKAQWSGSLHQAERELAGFGSPDYERLLRDAFGQAEGILVVNPMIAAMVSPYAKAVHVVPSGFDPERFPAPFWDTRHKHQTDLPARLFFAGLTDEYMKGFHVLREACQQLWRRRQDFELIVTGDNQSESAEPFVRYIGWQSQDELPRRMREADILVFPTIAEEALGRSAVEAMGCGLPVVASHIGGLPYTVTDQLTGLLCEPGNAPDLAAKIERLLDDPQFREQLGKAGRKRFEDDYTWDVIIERHYKSLLKPVLRRKVSPSLTPATPANLDKQSQLISDVSQFLGMPQSALQKMFETYRTFHNSEGQVRVLGESKSLNVEEVFLTGIVLSLMRPVNLIQIGSQDGLSTRRLVDLCQFLGLDTKITCFDKENPLRFASSEEVEFDETDLIGCFRTSVLDKYGSGCLVINIDSLPLRTEILFETALHYGSWAVVIQNCDQQLLDTALTTVGMGVFQSRILSTENSLGLLVPNHLCPACNAQHQQVETVSS